MANLLWNESAPADTDSAGQGDDEIRSLKTSIRNGLAAEHFWPSATGSGFGVHLLGSARPFYDVQSNVSSTGTDGRLMVTSDTSRLFHVGSAGTMFLGSSRDLSLGSAPVGGQRFYWAVETGMSVTDSSGAGIISFPNSGYSGRPFVLVSATPETSANVHAVVTFVTGGLTANVNTLITSSTTGAGRSNTTFTWISIGTRTF